MWGDSVAAARARGRWRWSPRAATSAVNALGSQRGIRWHTVVSTGNQAVCDASDWLDALAELDGVRSVALFLRVRRRRRTPRRGARALRRARRRRRRAEGRLLGGGRARPRRRTPGALAGDQRVFRALVEEAGGAWARDPHELLELARVLAEPRARPRRTTAGLAVLTCSGGDSGVAADEAEPPRHRAAAARADDPRAARPSCCPAAATIANPLDYTAMIWGDARAARADRRNGRRGPRNRPAAPLYDHPRDLSPESEASWAAVRDGIVAGAARPDAGTVVCLDPARPDRRRGDRGARRRGACRWWPGSRRR